GGRSPRLYPPPPPMWGGKRVPPPPAYDKFGVSRGACSRPKLPPEVDGSYVRAALANSPPVGLGSLVLSPSPTCCMGALNGKPVGRPPHKNSKEAPPVAGDELGAYSYSQLMRMDEKFRERMTRAIERGLERAPAARAA